LELKGIGRRRDIFLADDDYLAGDLSQKSSKVLTAWLLEQHSAQDNNVGTNFKQ
jgi:hypothetical protein